MAAVTFAQLKERARNRADMTGSNFISDAELGQYVNASAQELYDLLVAAYQDYYISVTSSSTLSSGQDSITLPADFYKLRGVDRQIGSTWVSLQAFSFAERNERSNLMGLAPYIHTDSGIRYRVQGTELKLTPQDNAEGTYRIWYTPLMPLLSSASDSFAGFNGFEEYIVVDAAIKMLAKEESSTTGLERQKAALLQRIQSMAKTVDDSQPEVIVPARVDYAWWRR